MLRPGADDLQPSATSQLLDALPQDAVLEMRHAVRLAEAGLFQLHSLRELVEQPTAPSEQDVDQVDPDLVHQPRGEELLVDIGAHEPDPLVGGGLLGPREGSLDPFGDGREDGVRLANGLWVTTKHGTSPSGPLPPHASIELS